jgi:hypothetical protein
MRISEVVDRLTDCGFAVMIYPATPRDLLSFSRELRDSGFSDLPLDYQEFLQYSNGLVLDDAVLFSTDSIISCDGEENFSDLLSYNLASKKLKSYKHSIVLGVSDDDLFMYDTAKQLYLVVDKTTHRPVDRYARFADLLSSLIEERRAIIV